MFMENELINKDDLRLKMTELNISVAAYRRATRYMKLSKYIWLASAVAYIIATIVIVAF